MPLKQPNAELKELLQAAAPTSKFKQGIVGSNLTTYAIGGPLDLLCEIESEEDLCSLFKVLYSNKFPFKILGAGSNLLIPDHGVSECVIKLGRGFRFITPQSGSTFLIGCSMPLISLSQELSQAGFSGLEFAGGIPASVGGAVRMNAGAHGGEIGALIKRVWLVNETAEIEEYSAKDLQFSYRHSSIKHGNLIYKIEIELTSGHKDLILGKRAEFLAHRKAAQPITLPSSGSIFRNPSPELSAGVLIERTGLKGFKVGAAKVSEKHGNWIVNEERKATALDVIAVISKCKEEAFAQFQINLQEEIIIW